MDIKANCQVGASGNTALQIQASDRRHITGAITAVSPDSGSITTGTVAIQGADGSSVTLTVNLGSGSGSSSITLDGTSLTSLATLLPGMHAKATYQLTSSGNNLIRMQVNDKLHVRGTITAVTPSAGSTTAGTVTITSAEGSTVTVNVDLSNGTTLRVNGNTATALSSLQMGMRAEARYQVTSGGNNAISLSARKTG